MTTHFSQVQLSFTLQDFLQQFTKETLLGNKTLTFLNPLKVKLKKSLFEEDYTESNMIANLISISIIDSFGTYFIEASFDFKPYEKNNLPLLTDRFYPNKYTVELPFKELYNAIEAKQYNPEISVYLGSIDFINDYFEKFVYATLDEFLEII